MRTVYGQDIHIYKYIRHLHTQNMCLQKPSGTRIHAHSLYIHGYTHTQIFSLHRCIHRHTQSEFLLRISSPSGVVIIEHGRLHVTNVQVTTRLRRESRNDLISAVSVSVSVSVSVCLCYCVCKSFSLLFV